MQTKNKYTRVAVKIGSNVLTRKDGTLDITRISHIVDQVSELYRQGMEIVLISSGAVASGRSEITPQKKLDAVSARQLYSSIGQAKLINCYYDLFREHKIPCGQVLTTKESFASRTHYLNQKNCMETMLANGVIPIVNENDTVSVTELMFTDNDELSGLIAAMMNMEALILLSNVDGVYTGNPSSPDASLISEIHASAADHTSFIQTEQKSSFGRGGMLTKYSISKKVADEGIPVIIANGMRSNILLKLLSGCDATPCTRFIPSQKPINSVKKWIAHSEGFAKGKVRVNAGAVEALTGNEASSVLLVGVIAIEGEFEKEDIICICDAEGEQIGVGRAAYDRVEAEALIGQKGHKPLVHYDYLYLE